MLEEIAALKARWLELYPNFATVREALLANVVRWEQSNWYRYDPRPFYFLRDRPRGRLLRRVPDAGVYHGIWQCGYDAQGRVISDGEIRAWEHLYEYTDNLVEVMDFQGYYNLLRGLGRLYYHNGQPSNYIGFRLIGHPEAFRGSAEELWQQGLSGHPLQFAIYREIYHYSGRQLTQINLTRWDDDRYLGREPETFELAYRLDYGANGRLQHITLNSDTTLYRHRQSGETLEALAEKAKSRLIAVIPQVIKKANFAEPLYCLKLQYLDDYFFPPTLEPGFESWRRHILETQTGIYVQNLIWATVREIGDDEPYPPFPIEDEAALIACENLQIETGRRGHWSRYQLAVRTLRQVARALNQLDWSQYTPVTPDFIVYAYDQDNITEALRYSGATPAQIEDWKKRGFLQGWK